ncbi:MAG: hypothetical protein QOH91_4504 [Mycobacterium sp.]|jgi:hypothetical protein|nr:hypothetical protein [Mycobacterium sp.]
MSALLRCTVAGFLAAAGLVACGHGSNVASQSSTSSRESTSTAGATEQVILKPVDAQGNTTAGYTKDDTYLDSRPIDCSFGEPSVHDVTSGVLDCGGTADNGDACWPTAHGTHVLCLLDPFQNVVFVRTAKGGNDPLKTRTHPPVPIGLILDDGTQCRFRVGGAGSRQVTHPDWVEAYTCTGSPNTFPSVWTPGDSVDGIDHTSDARTVQFGGSQEPLTTRKVTKALFVGMG